MYLYNSICCKAIWWPIISCPLGNAQSPQKAHLSTQKFFCTSSYFFIPFWPTASERMILCQLICMRGELYEYFIIISGEQPSSSSSSSSVERNQEGNILATGDKILGPSSCPVQDQHWMVTGTSSEFKDIIQNSYLFSIFKKMCQT